MLRTCELWSTRFCISPSAGARGPPRGRTAADDRADDAPSMIVIDTHLARGGRRCDRTAGRRARGVRLVPHVESRPRCRGSASWVGRQAAGVPAHSARLAHRGRPRAAGTLPVPREVVREHDRIGNRLASGRVHRHHDPPPLTGSSQPTSGAGSGMTAWPEPRGTRQRRALRCGRLGKCLLATGRAPRPMGEASRG